MGSSIGIYQACFKPELLERLDRGFLVLEWLANPVPALRELALHKHIADKKIYAKHQLTGVLSGKFFSKTKLESEQVYNWILDNPKHDIYLINGIPHVPYAGYNNVERAKIQRGDQFEMRMRTLYRRIGVELPQGTSAPDPSQPLLLQLLGRVGSVLGELDQRRHCAAI